jgi:hypothetical protein
MGQRVPTLQCWEAVKKSKYSPSTNPLPQGEKVNILKYKKKFPPPRRGRDRVGVEMGFFHTFWDHEGGYKPYIEAL